jgi:cytosine/adenosine deaminase-related metal-dependent hydrolase
MTGKIHRRAALGLGAAGLLAATLTGGGGAAAASATVDRLPRRTRLLIRGGHVMTMDRAGDLPGADVHIADGRIIQIGPGLSAPGAEVIDARDFVVMPGLVETHWHMWTGLMRGMRGSNAATGYFPMTEALSKAMTPDHMRLAAVLSSAEALNAGITTIHDWCHNIPSLAYAEADVAGLTSTGIRGRFSYGPGRLTPITQPIDVADMARLHADWASHSPEALLSLGMAWRGVQGTFTEAGRSEIRRLSPDVWRTEYDAARRLGLPISVHANTSADPGHVAALAELGLLFPDLQVVHGAANTTAEIEAMAAAGASLSVTPGAVLGSGGSLAAINEFRRRGVKVGLSLDGTVWSGTANLFEVMKVVRLLENSRTRNQFGLPPRQLLEMATLEGARSLGLGEVTGSLAPGKRADLILVDTRALHMAPFTVPEELLVDAARPEDVDTVIVDGRVLKRGGRLTAIDERRLALEANAVNRSMRSRAGWS